MSCQNIFVFTFLQCHGKVAFFETKMRVFIENKVKSCKTEGWRPSVQCNESKESAETPLSEQTKLILNPNRAGLLDVA